VYLNIPLHGSKTTRHRRRVVWTYGIVLGIWIILMWILAVLWFTRDLLSSYAPDETGVIIHLVPEKNHWDTLLRDFGHIPLISHRPFFLRDILPFTKGDLAIFLLKDGSTAVIIRTSESNIPVHKLEIYGISIQQLDRNIFLLSEHPLPFSPKKTLHLETKALFPGSLGSILFFEDQKIFRSSLYSVAKGYTFYLPREKEVSSPSLPVLPQKTIAAITFSPFSMDELFFILTKLNRLIEPIHADMLSSLKETLEKQGGIIAFTQTDMKNPHFILQFKTEKSNLLETILKIASAFQKPIIRPLLLPDGTSAQEIIIDPANTVVEQTNIEGNQSMRVQTAVGSLIGTNRESDSYLSTNEELLHFWLGSDKKDGQKTCAKNPVAIFFPPQASFFLLEEKHSIESNILLNLTKNFQQIGIFKTITGKKFLFCY